MITNDEAVKYFSSQIDIIKQWIQEPESHRDKNDMQNAISCYDKAIAALTPKPLEFPSWAEFSNERKYAFDCRGEYDLFITHQRTGKIVNIFANCDCYSNHVKEPIRFDYTESGYNAAIAQLNAWLEELIAELRGI